MIEGFLHRDGTCAVCGKRVSANGSTPFKCKCGWEQDPEAAARDKQALEEIFKEEFGEHDE